MQEKPADALTVRPPVVNHFGSEGSVGSGSSEGSVPSEGSVGSVGVGGSVGSGVTVMVIVRLPA